LVINSNFELEFRVSGKRGAARTVHLDESLKDWDWAYVAASYDADRGIVTLRSREKPCAPGDQTV
jgi:hypothetical protein